MTETEGNKSRTALVMEGGAMRGMFTCGVIDVLMENGISFEAACGVSAGAVFGCNLKSRQIGRPIRYNKEYCRDPRYCSLRSLLKTGDLYGVEFCYHELPDKLDPFDRETFRTDPTDFYIGTTCVETGEAVYHKCTDGEEEDILWMQASASMPGVSRPVRIGDRRYLDGGLVDTVPFEYMESLGYDRNVIVLTRPKGYRKKKSAGMRMYSLLLLRHPKIRKILVKRADRYNELAEKIDEKEKEGTAFVIRPPEDLSEGHVERDPEKLEEMYQAGRREMTRRLAELRAFLGETDR